MSHLYLVVFVLLQEFQLSLANRGKYVERVGRDDLCLIKIIQRFMRIT
jgi:hypothetical protein